VKIIRALADENRFRIFCLLAVKKDICVCEITAVIGLAQPTVSSHLKVLENAGLIESYKVGLWVNYNIVSGPDSFTAGLVKLTLENLQNDEQIKSDIKKIESTGRNIICCKPVKK
jgi:ArsR family transcriptional regulator